MDDAQFIRMCFFFFCGQNLQSADHEYLLVFDGFSFSVAQRNSQSVEPWMVAESALKLDQGRTHVAVGGYDLRPKTLTLLNLRDLKTSPSCSKEAHHL